MDTFKANAKSHLRLVWPQWQGGGTEALEIYASEFPLDVARRGYALGAMVLQAALPPHSGPTSLVPVTMDDDGTQTQDGIEAKPVLLRQLANALQVIEAHRPERITTLGGDCSVSVAPFAYLSGLYPDDLAVLWIDAHPDVGTAESAYKGYHAMAVSTLVGQGDPDITALLPATVRTDHVALVGLHSWTQDDYPHVGEWGLHAFSPTLLSASSEPLVHWLQSTKCKKIAIHFDVDSIDGNELFLGLGPEPKGLSTAHVRRIIEDVAQIADVVGLTVAEFIPRQAMHLQNILSGMPLI